MTTVVKVSILNAGNESVPTIYLGFIVGNTRSLDDRVDYSTMSALPVQLVAQKQFRRGSNASSRVTEESETLPYINEQ